VHVGLALRLPKSIARAFQLLELTTIQLASTKAKSNDEEHVRVRT